MERDVRSPAAAGAVEPSPSERRLADALAQQAATAAILRVMADSPDAVQAVLDAIAREAARLCHAPDARVFFGEADVLDCVATFPSPAVLPSRPVPVARTAITGRAVLAEATIHHADVVPLLDTEFPEARENALAVGFRAVLAVPLPGVSGGRGAILVWRREPVAFAPDQIALVETFAHQAAIALGGVRRYLALRESLDRERATGEILRVISRSPTDAQPVFDTIAGAALRLCDATAANVVTSDGELVHLAALANAGTTDAAALDAHFRTYPRPPSRETANTRAVLTRSVVVIPDILDDPDYAARSTALAAGYRSVLAVPLLREGRCLGAVTVARGRPGPFPAAQVALLQTFADQAVIAIENVRLFEELGRRNAELVESLEQQTATSEILRVISRSRTDVQPVFDTIATSVLKLCRAEFCNVFTYDGELIHLAAAVNVNADYIELLRSFFPRRAGKDTAATRAIASGEVCAIHDVLADADYAGALVRESASSGFRSVLAMPLMREGRAIGAIAVGRPQPGPFPAGQVALLQTFADQAVIAIESVRLFNEIERRNRELTVALEQQTATSEVLRSISTSQADAQPAFDMIAGSALRLCEGKFSVVYRYDGELIHIVALHDATPQGAAAFAAAYPCPPSRRGATQRAILTRAIVHMPDIRDEPEYAYRDVADAAQYRSVLAVPMLHDGAPIGAITVFRDAPGAFPDAQVALLQTFADQAVIAIENVRLFNELQRRNRDLVESLEQQTATGDILRVISRTQTDVQPVFDEIAAAALKLCRASAANVFTYDGELIRLAALLTQDPSPEYAQRLRARWPMPPGRSTGATRSILTRAVVEIPDILADPDYLISSELTSGGFRSVLSVPLMREGSPIGAISVGRTTAGSFPREQVVLLQTFADQAVIAIENVRLFNELRARTGELTRSVGELRALGEVGQAVSSTLDLATVLSTIVARAIELTGMDGGSIYEYDEAAGQFHLHTADRLPADLVAAMRTNPIRQGEGVLGRMALAGAPVQIPDISDAGAYRSPVRKLLIGHGYRALIAVPLWRDDHLLGGLAVNRKTPGPFAPDVIALLETFAAQSAIAIQNARLFREIEVKGRQLEQASRHKSEFLANMSHELRTPLNAIIGFSEVLAERMFGALNDKQEEYVGDILASGRHLLALINDILDLSKIEAGRLELELADCDVAAAVGNALTLVRERAQRRDIALACHVAPGIGVIRADERKVKQVLLNLLSNAIKFTPSGGRIAVRASDLGDAVEIAVQDSGVGIAPEDQAAVFEEFRQVGSAARQVEGTGLGLAISRKFVELHGGAIRVDSALGQGATFTFRLPRGAGG